MFLPGIPDKLWPVHPRPLEDELLTSWLVRCAHANGVRTESWCTALFGSRSAVWNRDFDRSISSTQIERIARCSGQAAADLQRCTLSALEGTLSQKINQRGNSPGLVPLRIFHRTRKGAGLMFCPVCLASGNTVYWRRLWRISYVTACPLHGCELLDVCERCGSAVAQHRVDMHWDIDPGKLNDLITRCHKCFHDLRECQTTVASLAQIRVAQLVANALRDGWVQMEESVSHRPLYAMSFFGGLRCLLAGIRSSDLRRSDRMSDQMHSEGYHAASGFDHDLLVDRRKQIEQVGKQLEDWPNAFLNGARRSGLTYTSLMADRWQTPYWIDSVAREALYKSFAAISDDQVESIARATDLRQVRFSVHAARMLSGVSLESRRFTQDWVGLVDRDTCEAFLVEIDHLVAQMWSKIQRLATVGDKVMFAFAWHFGLTQVQLSQVRIADIGQGRFVTSGALPRASFCEFPEAREQVLAWVNWYLTAIRPSLDPQAPEDRVFVSHTSRSALSASAIGERFRRYRLMTGMHRAIADYSCFVRSGQRSLDSRRLTKS